MKLEEYLTKYQKHEVSNFYSHKVNEIPRRDIRRLLRKERKLRLKSDLAVMDSGEKAWALFGHILGKGGFFIPADVAYRHQSRLDDMHEKLKSHALNLKANSERLDQYQGKIIDELGDFHISYLDALDDTKQHKGEMEKHREAISEYRIFSPDHVDALKLYLESKRRYLESAKDCVMNLKMRDMRYAELKVVSEVSKYSDVISFALALQATHTGLLAEHLGYINRTVELVSGSARAGSGIEKQLKKTTDHIERYTGLVRDIHSLKQKQMVKNMTSEGANLYVT